MCTQSTIILLVLIIKLSITYVQTKDIKNSPIFDKIVSETNDTTIDDLLSINRSIEYRLPHDNQSNLTFIKSINIISEIPTEPQIVLAPISSKNLNKIVTSTINESSTLTNLQQFHNKYTNKIHDINSNGSISNQSSPIPPSIATQQYVRINKIKSGKTNDRNGKDSVVRAALRIAARQGLEAMVEFYEKKEPSLLRKGLFLPQDHPGAKLSEFSAPLTDEAQNDAKAAFAALFTAKKLKHSLNLDFSQKSRQAPPKISLRRTPLEGLCPPRDQPLCSPISRRYRMHDGTCNNVRKGRWGSAQMPFNRFQSPAYADGIEEMRRSVLGGPLPSARFISLVVHGSKESDSPVTLMLAQWGQFIDHDLTSTAQPRSVNGSIPQCCGVSELHPSCSPIKVPMDDPWLAPLGIRCLEFLRSAPAQRRDCLLSWREQTNQVSSYLDASTIYSSSERNSENSRKFSNGLLLFGRGPPQNDVCLRGALASQCIRPGDGRSGEQPGLLAMHHSWVLEHNQIAAELADLNLHWSDEKIYQETRRIIGAMVQHITYREFLPLVLGRDVCKLFDLELRSTGYYTKYDARVNAAISNAFSAAAFRFGHSLIQNTYMRSTRNHQFIDNNVTLHEENSKGDIGSAGSLHRLLRGLSTQRAQKRDEFITAELTNHLFQSGTFPFGLDLAAINIQRGRDHGLPAYTQWREPCGLTPIADWEDLERVVGPRSAQRMQLGYTSIDDIDLFVGGLAERPVVGGLVGPVFACIIAQQFSNLRKGDRFWYENEGFESSFTPAQLQSIRQVNLAQVICRTLGSGTLQPHVFLPHTVPTNERLQCGTGSLSPIDLKPWLERDPFLKNPPSLNESKGTPDDDRGTKAPIIIPVNPNETILTKVDFPHTNFSKRPNKLSNIRHKNTMEPFIINGTIINNKLDLGIDKSRFNAATRPNKISNKVNTHMMLPNRPKRADRNRITTIRNKIRKSTRRTTVLTQSHTTQRTKKNKTKNRRKQKRDVTEEPNDKARSTIYIKIDKQTDEQSNYKTPFSSKKQDKDKLAKTPNKQYVIVTPDQNAYDIEIKIKAKHPQIAERIVVPTDIIDKPPIAHDTYYAAMDATTKKQEYFYNIAQPSLLDDTQYIVQDTPIKPQRPTLSEVTYQPYPGLIVKRPTTTERHTYGIQEDDVTVKPYFTTKRPPYYAATNVQQDDKPFYTYPTVQQTDQSSYYTANDDTHTQQDDYATNIQNANINTNTMRPYNTVPLFLTNYQDRPNSANRPAIANDHGPTNLYADQHPTYYRPKPTRPPFNAQQDSGGGYANDPTYLDDYTTKRPDRLTTTYSYSNINLQDDDFSNPYPLHEMYRPPSSTNRPQDFTTFYTVMTTRRKQTRPTKPMTYNQQNDDEDDEDEDSDSETYFNPTSVISNIVNSFSDYFSTPTTTRKPYVQQDDFYTYPSLPSQDFPYSRQKDVETGARNLNKIARRHDYIDDYEINTYRPVLNADYNDDITDDDKSIPYDRDGYLRPEYMKYNGPKQSSNIDVNIKIDLTPFQVMKNATDLRHAYNNDYIQYLLNRNMGQLRQHKQLTQLTVDRHSRPIRTDMTTPTRSNQPIGLIPINVLTKPERPDNWVMFDALHKVPLPQLPTIKSDYGEISSEMPRPIAFKRNAGSG